MKKFYEFKVNEEKEGAELLVYGDITSLEFFESDTSSFSFAKELSELDCNLTVRINSYGGEVAEGLAMYNLLREYAKTHTVSTVCDGFACSAASVVFMAGDIRKMSNAGLLLIHNAWTVAQGDSNAMRKTAEDLEKITAPSLAIYCEKTGLSEEKVKEMMDAETWITAQEALDMGFCTEIETESAKQSINEMYLTNAVNYIKALEKENRELKEKNETLSTPAEKSAWDKFFNK